MRKAGHDDRPLRNLQTSLWRAASLIDVDGLVVVVGTAPQGPPGHTNFIRLLHIATGRQRLVARLRSGNDGL